MKRCLTFLFLVGCLVQVCQSKKHCTIDNTTFVAGETLNYQLYYNLSFVWIQAGTCQFSVRSTSWGNKPVYQLMIQGKSQKSFDSFFKVRDTLVSYVDKDRLVPYKAFKFAHEDKWHGTDEFTFGEENGGWSVTTRLNRKKQWKAPVESWTSQCGFDLVTSLYRLRCMTNETFYEVGKRTKIPVRLEDDEYSIYLTYLGKERIKLYGGGYYVAHAFSLSMIEGKVFKRGDVLKMWVSDDGNKIPLLVESPIRVGFVKAVFRSAQSTLYPLVRGLSK
ncbi:MAG TPA: DUF3108 domain-containing protein [Bacteroidales bacterium]